ncbi:phosphotransferase [Rossellomorea aquimaris]|uniref:phosphotransferase enzyme family protein n=1 Tax=Rossellomorea aquimaris TaxID=189382 RepID=UPI001CD6F3C1|nr:phosphotransferase [Rossellomorea aquimaris]MCA1056530.1 phosphotransferase [Rossellomorea aquimaris]
MIELGSYWKLDEYELAGDHLNVLRVLSHGNSFYLKCRNSTSKKERLEEYRITNYLVERGVSVETPILTMDGQSFIESGDAHYSLYRTMRGSSTPNGSMIPPVSFSILGEYLSAFHSALMAYPMDADTPVWDLNGNLQKWLSVVAPEKEGWAYRISRMLSPYEALYGRLPVQLVHSDMHLRNFIWDGDRLCGMVDFERVRQAPRLADIAYLLVSLLRDYGGELESIGLARRIRNFIKGYTVNLPLSDEEQALLQPLGTNILLQYALFYSRNGFEEESDCHVRMIDSLIDGEYFSSIIGKS